jgi:holliday junction DNA helicase RuvA
MAAAGRLAALMIAHLRGRVLEKHPTRVIVETAGVGYELHVPLSSFSAIGEPGSDVALRVHTHVREDAIQLFGFATSLELSLFDRLIAVSGIGPRLALSLLSGIAPSELVQAVATSDVGRLVSIPGVGKKTAERIILELKDKLGGVTPSGASAADTTRADLVSALVNLGYHRPAAEKAVDHAIKVAPAGGFEQALRSALRTLTR